MNTTENLNTNVSDYEFNAAHDAYLAALNADIAGDSDDHIGLTRAYWGLGEKPVEIAAVEYKAETTILGKIKSIFLN